MNDYRFRKPRSGPAQPRKRVLVDDGPSYSVGYFPTPARFVTFEAQAEPAPWWVLAMREAAAEREG